MSWNKSKDNSFQYWFSKSFTPLSEIQTGKIAFMLGMYQFQNTPNAEK